MPTNRETLLCRYHYDPLDRLAACSLSEQASTQRFYLKTRLATEIQGSVQRSIFQQEDQLLAQQQRQGSTVETTLLATDQQRSVLNALDATRPHPLAYTPYGHRAPEGGLLSLLGFNGERPDPLTGHYLLGNGYRAFNPVLMRFNSPDSWSPFGEGGLNAYVYCLGDPVNRVDPTGHAGVTGMLKFIGRKLGLRESSRVARATRTYETATQAPVRATISQASAVPGGSAPPSSPGPSAHSSRGMSSQELGTPPPYSQSETHLGLPPYFPSDHITFLRDGRISMPVEAPPFYFREPPNPVSSPGQVRIQSGIDEPGAHPRQVERNVRDRQLSESTLETIDSITARIRDLRQRLAPQSSRQTRMP